MSRNLGDPTFGGPGYKVVERALATIQRYSMFEQGDSVIVAFSGGPDSTCLLDVLSRLRGKLGLEIAAAHVDHGLSEASADIAAKVSTAVAEAGFEIHVVRIPISRGRISTPALATSVTDSWTSSRETREPRTSPPVTPLTIAPRRPWRV